MTPFKLTTNSIIHFSRKLYQIELTADCKHGKKGDKGGYIEKLSNLSEDAWVSGNAHIYGNAQVSGDATVFGNAQVYGNESPIVHDFQIY